MVIMMFIGIECLIGMVSLQVEDNAKPYQVALRHIAYALQELFKKELDRQQQHQIITPLEVDEGAKWCKTFVIVPKPSGTKH